jgi:hypothetical protein
VYVCKWRLKKIESDLTSCDGGIGACRCFFLMGMDVMEEGTTGGTTGGGGGITTGLTMSVPLAGTGTTVCIMAFFGGTEIFIFITTV